MKFCENCGKEIDKLDKHCSHCGKKVINEPIATGNSSNMDGLGTASMVIGIISLVLSFVINIFIIPVALIGLILGIISKVHKGKKISGIILNIIAMLVSILVFILWMVLIVNVADNYDEKIKTIDSDSPIPTYDYFGTWSCKGILSKDNEIKLEINDDRTFILSDVKNSGNFIKGTYEDSDEELEHHFGINNYYAIELDANSRYENDVYKSSDDTEYDMFIAKGKNKSNAILAADDSEKIYYCNME